MAFYDINKRKLSTGFPGLFHDLDASPKKSGFEFVTSKIRGHTLRLGTRSLHSSFDPIAEARKQYSPVKGRFDLVILAGLGAGHLLEESLADPAVKAVRVLETDLGLLRLVLENREIHQVLSDPRVKLVWRPEELFRLVEPLDLVDLRTVTIISDASFAAGGQAVFPGSGLSSLVDSRITELLTFSRMGMVWVDNFIANFPLRKRFRSASRLGELVGKNKDRVLLVGAGPSLQDLLPRLKRDKDKYLVVAIDTIAKHLERNGLEPDIVVSVDSQAVSRLHFLNYSPRKAVFVLDVLSPPPVVSRFLDRAYFCKSGNPLSGLFSAGIPACREGLSAGNTAVELLAGLGAETIYLAGVDFSFPKDRVYTGGNYFSLYWSSRIERTRPLDGYFLRSILERRSEATATLSGGVTNTVPVMRQYAGALDSFIGNRPGLKVSSLSADMIAMKNVRPAESVPAGGAFRPEESRAEAHAGVPGPENGGDADSRLPAEWTREEVERYFYPAVHCLIHRRFKRSGKSGAADRDWAYGVLERKSRLFLRPGR